MFNWSQIFGSELSLKEILRRTEKELLLAEEEAIKAETMLLHLGAKRFPNEEQELKELNALEFYSYY